MKSSTCGARGAEEPRPKAVSGRPQERPGKEGASAAEVRPAAARGGLATLRRLLHQLHDALLSYLVVSPLERAQGGAAHEGRVVRGEVVQLEELAHLHLHQLEQLLVVSHVALVHKDDHARQPHLLREQHVLARLRHRPVRRRHDQDGAVHA